jgi:catechol-2,3-dioxygenase
MAPPAKFAHVVYKTRHLDEMVDWYVRVLECKVHHKDERLAFLTYDDEHHRVAFVNIGPGDEPGRGSAERASFHRPEVGVHHVAYTWNSLADLMDVYRRLKAQNILPIVKLRHGPTLSMYYADPDGNSMEFQVDLLSADAANDFMRGPEFAANPIGEPFDPEAIIAGIEAGKPLAELVLRSDQHAPPGGLAVALR